MKDHSKRISKQVVRFRTPSLYKANKAQVGHLRYDHLKGTKIGKSKRGRLT